MLEWVKQLSYVKIKPRSTMLLDRLEAPMLASFENLLTLLTIYIEGCIIFNQLKTVCVLCVFSPNIH